MSAPMRFIAADESGARGIETDFGERELSFPRQRGECDEECSRRRIRRHIDLDRRQTSRGPEADLIAIVLHVHAHRAQHPLGVIARQTLLGDAHFDRRDETGKQNRALHLSARSACIPVDAPQIHSPDRHRQAITVLEVELRAHVRERFGDALHRATTEARVSFESGGERVRGYDARHQARGRPAVSAIETLPRRGEPTETDALHAHVS